MHILKTGLIFDVGPIRLDLAKEFTILNLWTLTRGE